MPGEQKDDRFLGNVCKHLQGKFGIGHSTIQIERDASQHVGANCKKESV